jgi:hypothetical protein
VISTPWLYESVTVSTLEVPVRWSVITYPDPTEPPPTEPDPEDQTKEKP